MRSCATVGSARAPTRRLRMTCRLHPSRSSHDDSVRVRLVTERGCHLRAAPDLSGAPDTPVSFGRQMFEIDAIRPVMLPLLSALKLSSAPPAPFFTPTAAPIVFRNFTRY